MSDLFHAAGAAASGLFKTAGTRLKRRPAPGAGALILSGAALLGGAALDEALLARAEQPHPAGGGFVEIDGVRVHSLEKGTGEPIALIHGSGVTAHDWVLSGV